MPWHRRSNAFGAAAHGSGTCCASPRRHLRAGVAAHSGGAAARCRSYVDSRFSLKQRPRLLCGGMASAQGFLSTWSLEPTAIPEEVDRVVVSSPAPPQALGAAADKTPPPGAGAQARAPRTSRRTTALLHTPCSSTRAHIFPLRQGGKPAPAAAGGGRLAPGGGRRRQGASTTQSQRICLMLPKHMTALRQGVAPRAPEVMLDDAVQAHLGRLSPPTTMKNPEGAVPLPTKE